MSVSEALGKIALKATLFMRILEIFTKRNRFSSERDMKYFQIWMSSLHPLSVPVLLSFLSNWLSWCWYWGDISSFMSWSVEKSLVTCSPFSALTCAPPPARALIPGTPATTGGTTTPWVRHGYYFVVVLSDPCLHLDECFLFFNLHPSPLQMFNCSSGWDTANQINSKWYLGTVPLSWF